MLVNVLNFDSHHSILLYIVLLCASYSLNQVFLILRPEFNLITNIGP